MQVRQVSGVVVYRLRKNSELEIMLLCKHDGGSWNHPKGGVEVDLTERESAAKEAFEEAGVIGKPGMALGTVDFFKRGMIQHVQMYAMQAGEILDDYPEKELRDRSWFPVKEAMDALDRYNQVFVARLVHALQQSGAMA